MTGPSWHSACSYVHEAAQMIAPSDSLARTVRLCVAIR